jgi:hypothetical protein
MTIFKFLNNYLYKYFFNIRLLKEIINKFSKRLDNVTTLNEAHTAMTKDIEKYKYKTNNFTENSFEISNDVINKMDMLMNYYKQKILRF